MMRQIYSRAKEVISWVPCDTWNPYGFGGYSRSKGDGIESLIKNKAETIEAQQKKANRMSENWSEL